MTDIFIYAVAIMYSPGPVNLLGLHCGLNGRFQHSFGYFFGVGSAMLLLFLTFGYLGGKYIAANFLPYFASFGCSYILYIALKVWLSRIELNSSSAGSNLTYFDGLGLQLLNPKGVVATLPISTVQMPAAGIEGWGILLVSFLLALLATGAPTSYAVLGTMLGKKISSTKVLFAFNKLMALLLLYVAVTIAWEHIL